jgi:hypothetical protein
MYCSFFLLKKNRKKKKEKNSSPARPTYVNAGLLLQLMSWLSGSDRQGGLLLLSRSPRLRGRGPYSEVKAGTRRGA